MLQLTPAENLTSNTFFLVVSSCSSTLFLKDIFFRIYNSFFFFLCALFLKALRVMVMIIVKQVQSHNSLGQRVCVWVLHTYLICYSTAQVL